MAKRMNTIFQKVAPDELESFRVMVEAYWRELMPASPVVRYAAQGDQYFASRFAWEGESRHPFWAIVDGERVGFVMFVIEEDRSFAQIHDFFIEQRHRRRGVGSAVATELISLLWTRGIPRIDLNVRADNAVALRFWTHQGFDVALHRLRRYRNPIEDGA